MSRVIDFRSIPLASNKRGSSKTATVQANLAVLGNSDTLDDAIRSAMALTETELLFTLERITKLVVQAEGQGDEAEFYKRIIALHAITSIVLLKGNRL